MDLATLVGLVLGFVMIIFGIVSSASFAAITESFIDLPSIIITIGGTISCLITSYTFKDLITYLKGAGIAFKDPKLDHGAVISKIIELSNLARKEGLLALEEVASNLEDEFMKKGILLIVDGTEPELVRGILETELANMDDRHRKVSGFFDYMAAMGGNEKTAKDIENLLGEKKEAQESRSEERRVGKECRSRWSPYH